MWIVLLAFVVVGILVLIFTEMRDDEQWRKEQRNRAIRDAVREWKNRNVGGGH